MEYPPCSLSILSFQTCHSLNATNLSFFVCLTFLLPLKAPKLFSVVPRQWLWKEKSGCDRTLSSPAEGSEVSEAACCSCTKCQVSQREKQMCSIEVVLLGSCASLRCSAFTAPWGLDTVAFVNWQWVLMVSRAQHSPSVFWAYRWTVGFVVYSLFYVHCTLPLWKSSIWSLKFTTADSLLLQDCLSSIQPFYIGFSLPELGILHDTCFYILEASWTINCDLS